MHIAAAQPKPKPAGRPAPVLRNENRSSQPAQRPPTQPNGNPANRPMMQARPDAEQHLSQWMNSHSNLTLEQKQQALEQEPGFRQLPPGEQLRIHNQVARLNNMTPEEQQRAIRRTEAMERLSPPQRQQVRSTLGQLGNLPEDRRRAVAHAFHTLSSMPEPQRQAYLNSPQYRAQFSDQERGTINGLLTISPMLPPEMLGNQPH